MNSRHNGQFCVRVLARAFRGGRSFLLVIAAAGVLSYGCAKQQAAPPPRGAVPVTVTKVAQKTMPLQLTAIGNVEAYSVVSIRAQVAGELLEVHFTEGDSVHKGQLLFTIDPRPFEAALAQAEAALARDKAMAANYLNQAKRSSDLFAAGVVARQEVDTTKATADASNATVQADEAAIQTAKLNLSYTSVYSPIDGRTGALMVKPGNLVKVADVPIVVINQVSPIYVDFTLPQQYLPDLKKHMARGTLRVLANLPDEQGAVEQGALTFVDNLVDTTTGTIHLKATFTNAQNRLWPGLFVNVMLRLSEQPNSIVIPAQAITAGQSGQFVYVVRGDHTVESRSITPAMTVEGETVITKGLQPGETIVTDGQMRLTPGAKVDIKNDPNPAESSTPQRLPKRAPQT